MKYRYAPWEIFTVIDGKSEEFYEAGVLLQNGEEVARKLSRANMSTSRNYEVRLYANGDLLQTWVNGRRT